jgi:ring-1,2-phenylacetyl-CoA epoxidase subunit PaaD
MVAIAQPLNLQALQERIGAIADPEIPAVTLLDLGILRSVEQAPNQPVIVTLTPTYSGCPATDMINLQVRQVLQDTGHADAQIKLQLAPAWSTDWITEQGRAKLRAYGIAPPSGSSAVQQEKVVQLNSRVPKQTGPECPRCSSPNVEPLSEFGSTACKALYRCRLCKEPFDYFKPY